jgi:hypothetical protein
MGGVKNVQRTIDGKPTGMRTLEDLVLYVQIMLKWVLKNIDRRMCTRSIWLTIGFGSGFLRAWE